MSNKLKEKFRKADKESQTGEEAAKRFVCIADKYLSDFIQWIGIGDAVQANDVIKLFKEDYEKRTN
jgi:hypothetical protein